MEDAGERRLVMVAHRLEIAAFLPQPNRNTCSSAQEKLEARTSLPVFLTMAHPCTSFLLLSAFMTHPFSGFGGGNAMNNGGCPPLGYGDREAKKKHPKNILVHLRVKLSSLNTYLFSKYDDALVVSRFSFLQKYLRPLCRSPEGFRGLRDEETTIVDLPTSLWEMKYMKAKSFGVSVRCGGAESDEVRGLFFFEVCISLSSIFSFSPNRRTFLPNGYPASVRKEYMEYQTWDTVQVCGGHKCDTRDSRTSIFFF